MAEISDLGLSVPRPVRQSLSRCVDRACPTPSSASGSTGQRRKRCSPTALLTILNGFGILIALLAGGASFCPDMAQYSLLIYIYVHDGIACAPSAQFVAQPPVEQLTAVDGMLCVATMAFYNYLVSFQSGRPATLCPAIISSDLVGVLFLMFTGGLWDFID